MDVLSIFSHLRGDGGLWSGWEMDQLSRLKAASASVLENQIWEDGVTDNGDPWIVAVDEDSLELSLHVARLSGAYVAVSGDLLPVASSANLKSVVNDCLTYIRSNRQETTPNDGATIRMPVGVSAAAFGIFLTERMTSFDEAPDQAQTNLHLSNLGPNPTESFVFLSGLTTSPIPLIVDESGVLTTEDQSTLGADQAFLDAFEFEVISPTVENTPPTGKFETKATQETDIASLAVTSSKTAKPLAVSNPHAEQPTDLPLTKADVTATVSTQLAEGGGAESVAIGFMKVSVGEDKADEEVVVDQPETGAEVVVASTEITTTSSGSSIAPTPTSEDLPVKAGDDAGDTLALDLLPLDQPQSLPLIDQAERLAATWPTPDMSNDIFQI